MNVKDKGAVGNGENPDRNAIQQAINDAGNSGTIYFPKGIYKIDGTLCGKPNQKFIGESKFGSVIYRDMNFGDTLQIGTGAGENAAGAFEVRDLSFTHSSMYSVGDTVLKAPASSGAHIRATVGQSFLIQNCRFTRLPYNVVLDGCTYGNIKDCYFIGVYDHKRPPLQEGIASVLLENTSGLCQILNFTNNQFSGANSPKRHVTWGTAEIEQAENIGPQFGILIYGCEDLSVIGNYFGGQNRSAIMTNFKTGTANLQYRFVGNFFDGARENNINFGTDDKNVAIRNLIIQGNNFNGQDNSFHAIFSYNSIDVKAPVVNAAIINGNTFNNYQGSCLDLFSINNAIITNNNFQSWNVKNGGSDAQWTAAAFCDQSTHVHFRNNIFGFGTVPQNALGFVFGGSALMCDETDNIECR